MRHLILSLLAITLTSCVNTYASLHTPLEPEKACARIDQILNLGRDKTTKSHIRAYANVITKTYLRIGSSATPEQREYARSSARELLLKPCGKESALELTSIADQLVLLGYTDDAVTTYTAAIAASTTPFFIEKLRQKLAELEQKVD